MFHACRRHKPRTFVVTLATLIAICCLVVNIFVLKNIEYESDIFQSLFLMYMIYFLSGCALLFCNRFLVGEFYYTYDDWEKKVIDTPRPWRKIIQELPVWLMFKSVPFSHHYGQDAIYVDWILQIIIIN